MPEPIEQTIAIINSPDSKLRDITPIIYRLNDSHPAHITRFRYLDQTCCASGTMRNWLSTEYGSKGWHMQTDQKDDSPMFALVRDPRERWWSGVRSWMNNLPWYSWWENEQLMTDYFPHFNRFTTSQWQILDQVEVDHYIKVDSDLADRFANFCRKHKLLQYGRLKKFKNHRHQDENVMKMENTGRSQLEKFLRQNKKWNDKLEEFLAPDYAYWDRVSGQA